MLGTIDKLSEWRKMKNLIIAALMAVATSVSAEPLHISGELATSRNPGGSALATTTWDKAGFSLSWNVVQVDDVFTYEYLLRAASPIYDFIVETDLLHQSDLLPGTTNLWEFGTFVSDHTDLTLPDEITGMKTVFVDERNTQSVNIVTHGSPQWGNFYSYGEPPDKPLIGVIPTGAWNVGFQFDPPMFVSSDPIPYGYLPVPSQMTSVTVPEPIMGLGIVLLGLVLGLRFFDKSRNV